VTLRGLAGFIAALSLAACAPTASQLPATPVPYGSAIVVDAQPVPLDPRDPAHQQLGNFTYAGGLHITSRQTSRLHGLSDLKVWPDGRFISESDQGDLLEGRLVLDGAGRLVGVTDARISTLKDDKDVDWYASGEKEMDSEGVAEFPNGDRLVSFEQDDRVLLYPHGGGPPRPAPKPQITYVYNKGMEGLALEPLIAPDAYRVGIEATGQTFVCRLSTACVHDADLGLEGLALSALDVLPDGRLVYLIRDYNALRGNIVRLRIADRQGKVIDGMELARPLTVDNFEGVAGLPRADGSVRFYIIVDDNFGTYAGLPTDQRTLLMAFDWTPKP
jgi:hypothetical protein